MPELAPLAVGQIIHGFANGAFGRDSYNCRKIEAVGPDWIVCRTESGAVLLATGREVLQLCQANRHPFVNPYDDDEECCTPAWRDTVPLTTWGRS